MNEGRGVRYLHGMWAILLPLMFAKNVILSVITSLAARVHGKPVSFTWTFVDQEHYQHHLLMPILLK